MRTGALLGFLLLIGCQQIERPYRGLALPMRYIFLVSGKREAIGPEVKIRYAYPQLDTQDICQRSAHRWMMRNLGDTLSASPLEFAKISLVQLEQYYQRHNRAVLRDEAVIHIQRAGTDWLSMKFTRIYDLGVSKSYYFESEAVFRKGETGPLPLAALLRPGQEHQLFKLAVMETVRPERVVQVGLTQNGLRLVLLPDWGNDLHEEDIRCVPYLELADILKPEYLPAK